MHENNNGTNAASKTKEVIHLLEEICVKNGVEVKSVANDLYEEMKQAEEIAMGKVKAAVHLINDATHNSPWPYIGGAAAFGVLLGLLLPFRR